MKDVQLVLVSMECQLKLTIREVQMKVRVSGERNRIEKQQLLEH